MNMLDEAPADLVSLAPEDIEAALTRARDRLAWVATRPLHERATLITADTTHDAAVIVHLSERLSSNGPMVPVIRGDLRLGHLELVSARYHVRWKGEPVAQTATQFKMIRLLASQPNMAVTFLDLYRCHRRDGFHVGRDEDGYRSNVRTFVKRIRSAFKEIDPTFDEIVNQSGVGYFWRHPEGDAQ